MNRREKEKIKQLDFEIIFFEKLSRRKPDSVEALMPLAENYTQRGLYKAGLKVDQQLARLRPADALVWYNLACSYALTNASSAAIAALKKAIARGYRDFKHMLNDRDLDSIKSDPRFQYLLKKGVRSRARKPRASLALDIIKE